MIPYWVLLVMAGLRATDALVTIALIGKDRKPIDPSTAIIGVVWAAIIATVLVLAALTGTYR